MVVIVILVILLLVTLPTSKGSGFVFFSSVSSVSLFFSVGKCSQLTNQRYEFNGSQILKFNNCSSPNNSYVVDTNGGEFWEEFPTYRPSVWYSEESGELYYDQVCHLGGGGGEERSFVVSCLESNFTRTVYNESDCQGVGVEEMVIGETKCPRYNLSGNYVYKYEYLEDGVLEMSSTFVVGECWVNIDSPVIGGEITFVKYLCWKSKVVVEYFTDENCSTIVREDIFESGVVGSNGIRYLCHYDEEIGRIDSSRLQIQVFQSYSEGPCDLELQEMSLMEFVCVDPSIGADINVLAEELSCFSTEDFQYLIVREHNQTDCSYWENPKAHLGYEEVSGYDDETCRSWKYNNTDSGYGFQYTCSPGVNRNYSIINVFYDDDCAEFNYGQVTHCGDSCLHLQSSYLKVYCNDENVMMLYYSDENCTSEPERRLMQLDHCVNKMKLETYDELPSSTVFLNYHAEDETCSEMDPSKLLKLFGCIPTGGSTSMRSDCFRTFTKTYAIQQWFSNKNCSGTAGRCTFVDDNSCVDVRMDLDYGEWTCPYLTPPSSNFGFAVKKSYNANDCSSGSCAEWVENYPAESCVKVVENSYVKHFCTVDQVIKLTYNDSSCFADSNILSVEFFQRNQCDSTEIWYDCLNESDIPDGLIAYPDHISSCDDNFGLRVNILENACIRLVAEKMHRFQCISTANKTFLIVNEYFGEDCSAGSSTFVLENEECRSMEGWELRCPSANATLDIKPTYVVRKFYDSTDVDCSGNEILKMVFFNEECSNFLDPERYTTFYCGADSKIVAVYYNDSDCENEVDYEYFVQNECGNRGSANSLLTCTSEGLGDLQGLSGSIYEDNHCVEGEEKSTFAVSKENFCFSLSRLSATFGCTGDDMVITMFDDDLCSSSALVAQSSLREGLCDAFGGFDYLKTLGCFQEQEEPPEGSCCSCILSSWLFFSMFFLMFF